MDFALRQSLPTLPARVVSLFCVIVTAVTYLRTAGGTPSFPSTRWLWEFYDSASSSALSLLPQLSIPAEVDCLSFIRRTASSVGFSDEVAQLLAVCSRGPTRRHYQARGLICRRWGRSRTPSISSPTIDMIADFLLYLRRVKGLSLSSIGGYRSILSASFRYVPPEASGSPVLMVPIRSLSIECPVKSTRAPPWDFAEFSGSSGVSPLRLSGGQLCVTFPGGPFSSFLWLRPYVLAISWQCLSRCPSSVPQCTCLLYQSSMPRPNRNKISCPVHSPLYHLMKLQLLYLGRFCCARCVPYVFIFLGLRDSSVVLVRFLSPRSTARVLSRSMLLAIFFGKF